MREYRRFVWDSALSYLGSKTNMALVRQHMSLSEYSKPGSFPEVYLRFLQSLSNRQGIRNTIGRIEELETVFCRFDHQETLQRYSNDWEGLFDTIQAEVKPRSRMDKGNPRSYWVIFCKGGISGANYLARFSSLEEFLRFVSDFDAKISTRPALPLLMAHDVFGYGFSLACDFLKEIGFSNYAKPDTHLADIFSGLGLSGKSPLDVFRAISLLADEVEETPYAVDKAFWLIGSGKLYLHRIRFKTSKSEFIQLVQQGWERRTRANRVD